MYDTLVPKSSLRDLGYAFNDNGELRTIQNDLPFQFTTQQAYEELGEVITHEVYNLLEKLGLQRLRLKRPKDNFPEEEYSFIYASPDFDQQDTLLVLIHGSGVVRAGQWARKLIINESLDAGTQIPYIERALRNGWGVVVTNTNNNVHMINGEKMQLRYSKTSVQHLTNVWYRFIRYSRNNTIHIVAHSRGGHDVSELLEKLPDEKRIDIVCLTDAYFVFSHLRQCYPIVVNWAAKPKERIRRKKCIDRHVLYEMWAGTSEHERSSHMSFEPIFYVMENLPNRNNIERLLGEAWELLDLPRLRLEGRANVRNNEEVDEAIDVLETEVIEEEIVDHFIPDEPEDPSEPLPSSTGNVDLKHEENGEESPSAKKKRIDD